MSEVREKIREQCSVPAQNQLLKCNKRTLNEDGNGRRRWSEMQVNFGSIVQLVVVMHATTTPARSANSTGVQLRNLIFKLSWTQTLTGQKTEFGRPQIIHLNGICSVFDDFGSELGYVWFKERWIHRLGWAIEHSGPSGHGKATQSICVDLQQLGRQAKYLFFTLSSMKGLSSIRDPSVALFDSRRQKLAEYSPGMRRQTDARSDGASIILCCAKRQPDGSWITVECGVPTDGWVSGTKSNYPPISAATRELIQTHFQD